jgi:hypothetical protein
MRRRAQKMILDLPDGSDDYFRRNPKAQQIISEEVEAARLLINQRQAA